jgi:hypothetical protein
MPKAAEHSEDSTTGEEDVSNLHDQSTKILTDRGRSAQMAQVRRGQPPPPPPPPRPVKPSSVRPIFDEDLHAAPTMIIEVGRMRQNARKRS